MDTIEYTDWYINQVNNISQVDHTSEFYYDMIDALEDGYTLEVE